MKTVYVDNNATTKTAPEVVDEMLPYFSELYGNPSSMHFFGGKIAAKIEEARARIACLINAEPDEIIFTSCGTESDNTAIVSTIESRPNKKHILTTRVEHPAVRNMCSSLSEKGYRITSVPVDSKGALDLDYLYDSITDDTGIVSIMWANNETGTIFPIEDIAQNLADKNVVFHTDAVQAAGKIPVDVKKTPVDLLALSGHKLHAPKGIGALYIKKGTRFSPFLVGGHQEKGRRGGTENVASIIGMGKAYELAAKYIQEEAVYIAKLRDRLENGLINKIPKSIINGDKKNRLPGTTNISFKYIEGEAILLMIDQFGICASSGSACTSGSLEPSHVLRAMGVPYTAAHGSIRFSLSRYNTIEEIDYIIEKVPPVIEHLRNMSPFWNQGV